jgi:diguanylate cyclase (GGDEF)-like protein
MIRPGSVPARRVLVVEPDRAVAAQVADAIRAAGMEPHVVHEAEAGLRTLAATEPQVLIVELDLPGRDGQWLLRRLRDDFMGARPRVVVTTRADGVSRVANLGADAVVIKPAAPEVVASAAIDRVEPTAGGAAGELVKLSLLAGDLDGALSTLAKRVALLFRVAECIVVGQVGDKQHLGVSRGPVEGESEAFLWAHCRSALEAGSSILASGELGGTASYLAVPFTNQVGGQQLGFLLLSDDRPRIFPLEVVDMLRALGQRIYTELSWRSVHERISADRDRLRESSMLDPMLQGVWTRVALEQALPGEVSACQRRGEPMTVAIMDLRGLRQLNERYGHVTGDDALRHIARIVRGTLRTQDLVARFAGDAISLVMAGTSVEGARLVIERLHEGISTTPLTVGETEINLGVVTGISGLGEDDTGEGALLRASAAMKLAKRRGQSILVAEEVVEDLAGMSSAPTEGLETGATLGGMYQILHEISRGAMGVVYRAEDLGLGRPVALKTLRPDLARDRNFVDRFRTEAATLASLRHENLVQVYAFGSDDDNVYFVMELVEGEPMEDRVEMARHEGRLIPMDLVEKVITQIAAALETMHQAGILHRDVKPANILLDRARARAVLVDVGIAKRRTSEADPAGTPGFTAPESFTGAAESTAADVYGLAATAYTLLSTAAPFGGGTVDEILKRQVASAPISCARIRPRLPMAVDAVLLRALDPTPSIRPQSAMEFALALAGALARCPPDVRAGSDKVIFDRPAAPAPKEDLVIADVPDVQPDGSTAVVSVEGEPRTSVVGKTFDQLGATMSMGAAGGSVVADVDRGRVATAASMLSSMREPEMPEVSVPHTRGVLFRSAYRVLGARHGAAWVAMVSRKLPLLGQALQPQSTLLSWHPTELFVEMLRAIRESGRDPKAFARELGRVATSATFGRFFGANPAALSPWQVLSAVDLFWRRYHTWGVVGVERRGEHGTVITVGGSPRDALVCAATEGIFEQVGLLAGSPQVKVVELACESTGHEACSFEITWARRV